MTVLDSNGTTVFESKERKYEGRIDNIQVWWPRDMGEPILYQFVVRFIELVLFSVIGEIIIILTLCPQLLKCRIGNLISRLKACGHYEYALTTLHPICSLIRSILILKKEEGSDARW